MDLAKIRKKPLPLCKDLDDERSFVLPFTPELTHDETVTVPVSHVFTNDNYYQNVFSSSPSASLTAAPSFISAVHHESVGNKCATPLEAIIAGRIAAGCDDESILADEVRDEIVVEAPLEILCFRVSNEIYGVNIMDIKEIITSKEVTEVPRVPAFVSGIISLRGTIIPIIDMRARLGLAREEPTGKERIVVIRSGDSFSGLQVDEVIHVVRVQLDSVEAAPTILDGIDRDFVNGLGRSEGRLIILLNLENIIDTNLC